MFKEETKIGYALALLDIATEEKKMKTFYEQTKLLNSILNDEESVELIKLLDSLSLNQDAKEKIIDKIFAKEIHWSFINSMKILSSKCQFRFWKDILRILIKKLQEELKIKSGIVYSVKPLTKIELKKLEEKLSSEMNYQISLTNLIDKELIAGFRVEVDNEIIENSIKLELELMKQNLKIKKGGVI